MNFIPRTLLFGLIVLAEAAAVIALIFGFIKESKVVKAERGAFRFLKSLRRRMHAARERELERELSRAAYADEYRTERRSKPAAADGKKRKSQNDRVA